MAHQRKVEHTIPVPIRMPDSPGGNSFRSMRSDPGSPYTPSTFSGRLGNSVRSHESLRSLAGEASPLLRRSRDNDDASKSYYDDEEGPPSFLVWIWPALVCALAYAFYNIFIKLGSATIHPILGGVILQIIAAMLGLILLTGLAIKERKGNIREIIYFDYWGVVWSICAGLAVGTAEMLSFVVSGMGVPATQSIPILIGGSVMFGSVLGVILLAERMTYQGWLGVILLVTGIAMVATDPGSNLDA